MANDVIRQAFGQRAAAAIHALAAHGIDREGNVLAVLVVERDIEVAVVKDPPDDVVDQFQDGRRVSQFAEGLADLVQRAQLGGAALNGLFNPLAFGEVQQGPDDGRLPI